MKAEYTQGSIPSMMLKSALAMLAGTLAMSGYNFADTYYIGRLGGVTPLAAMGFTFPVVMLVGCIFHGVGGGAMTTMAHAIGRDDQKDACLLVSSGMLLLALVSAFLAIVGLLTADRLYPLMGAQGETLVQLKRYMAIWFYGCITASVAMMGNDLLVAAGKPKLSALFHIFGLGINVILDPIMIFGGVACQSKLTAWAPDCLKGTVHAVMSLTRCCPRMEISGAAIATIVSQAISAIAILWLLHRVKLLAFRKIPWTVLWPAWKRIITYAIPAILGMLLFPMTHYVVTWVTSQFGDAMVAAIAAGGRLESFAFVAPMAFGIPLMSIIAQNYGARLYDRTRFAFAFASTVAFSFLMVAAVVFYVWAPTMVTWISTSPEVQEKTILYMRILPWGFGILELTRYSGFVLMGCGHPRMDASLKAVRMLGILMPCVLLTYRFHWEPGVFVSRLTTDVVGGLISIAIACIVLHRLPKGNLGDGTEK